MRRVLALVASGVLLAACSPAPAPVTTMGPLSTLTVRGEADVRQVPTYATVSIDVNGQAPTGAAAMRLQRERSEKVIAALREAGVAEADMQTTNLSLQPNTTWVRNRPIRDFVASNSVDATLRDLAKMGETLDAVVAAGGQIRYGLTFHTDEAGGAEGQARQAAIKDALARADSYASAMGYRVKRVLTVAEPGISTQPYYAEQRAYDVSPEMSLTQAAGPSTPVLPGRNIIIAWVDMTVELERAPTAPSSP